MSVRTRTTGPGPFSRIPTTPSLPTPLVTWAPACFSSAATLAEVCTSWYESSGWVWKCL